MNPALPVENTLTAELELARQVQTSLLPKSSCCLGSWMFAFSYEPAAAVGGDYVDSVIVSSRSTMLINTSLKYRRNSSRSFIRLIVPPQISAFAASDCGKCRLISQTDLFKRRE